MRIPYNKNLVRLHREATLIIKARGGKERQISPDKWWVNRNTPVGEDAELWERMPYQGKRRIPWDKIVAMEL